MEVQIGMLDYAIALKGQGALKGQLIDTGTPSEARQN